MIINVKVSPKSKLNSVTQLDAQNYHIHTTAAPDKDKANEAAIKLLANYLNIPKSKLSITRGRTSRHKTIAIIS
jgi:uncharacterized protein